MKAGLSYNQAWAKAAEFQLIKYRRVMKVFINDNTGKTFQRKQSLLYGGTETTREN